VRRVESWLRVLEGSVQGLCVTSSAALGEACVALASSHETIAPAELYVHAPRDGPLQALRTNQSAFGELLISFNDAVVKTVVPQLRRAVDAARKASREDLQLRVDALPNRPEAAFVWKEPFVYLSDEQFWAAVGEAWAPLEDMTRRFVGGSTTIRGRVDPKPFARHLIESLCSLGNRQAPVQLAVALRLIAIYGHFSGAVCERVSRNTLGFARRHRTEPLEDSEVKWGHVTSSLEVLTVWSEREGAFLLRPVVYGIDNWVKITSVGSGGYHQRDLCSFCVHSLWSDHLHGAAGELPAAGVGGGETACPFCQARPVVGPRRCCDVCMRIPPEPVSASVARSCIKAAHRYPNPRTPHPKPQTFQG
jgi:hypothetical protein